jgi:hypothetical protein
MWDGAKLAYNMAFDTAKAVGRGIKKVSSGW